MNFRPILITVADLSLLPVERHREPVRLGVTIPRGTVPGKAAWVLTDADGRTVQVQTRVLDRWSDDTIRWLLVDFQANAAPGERRQYRLSPGEPPHQSTSIEIVQSAGAIRVSTGGAIFDLPLNGAGFISAVQVGQHSSLQSATATAEDAHGKRHQFTVDQATVIDGGPLRATVRLDGRFKAEDGLDWLDCVFHLSFYAGLGAVGVEFSVTNPRAAQHEGNTWDLGDPGSVLIRELSIELVANGIPSDKVFGSPSAGDPMTAAQPRFSLYQDSSGGVNWQHSNHVNREGRIPSAFRGFRAELGNRVIEGLRATPIVAVGDGPQQISATVPRFWQLCPKAISAGDGRCVIGMFPRQYGDLHELQGGERSTLQFSLCFGGDSISASPLAWARAPLNICADSESYRDAGLWSPIKVGSSSAIDRYRELVAAAVTGDDSFAQRREAIDEYGWRNFGDLYADHEAVNSPLVSHYNNQYDAIAGFITRHLETADPQWWRLADELASHVADIDLYHTTRDRSAYSGGHFWHTQHYQPAATATHRTYSRSYGSGGGGPSAEHNYTTGLMLHYFLTGAERSRAAVVQLADWVINMDDGAKSRFRWIDRGDTGSASGTRSSDFHGPGRGAGNSINALLDAHRLTNDDRYLEKADALVQRCVHPDDDPAALDLKDIENRWSYTVFMQVLGKYIEYRADRNQFDTLYACAHRVLLKYASWMAAEERPYLDSPERLEFPNETWAAQDIRKAAVFEWAGAIADDPAQKAVFIDRATAFFEYSTGYLCDAPTGRLTRPLVLMLAYGFQRPLRPLVQSTAVLAAAPARVHFVPQRRRVVKRLKVASAVLFAAAAAMIFMLAR